MNRGGFNCLRIQNVPTTNFCVGIQIVLFGLNIIMFARVIDASTFYRNVNEE